MGTKGNLVSEAGHSRALGDTGFEDLRNFEMVLKRRLFTSKASNKWSWRVANSGRRQVRYRNTTRIEVVSQKKNEESSISQEPFKIVIFLKGSGKAQWVYWS